MEFSASSRPVVAGYDGSAHARLAVEWAVEEARSLGTRLVVVQAHQPPQSARAQAPLALELFGDVPAEPAGTDTVDDLVRWLRDPATSDVEIDGEIRQGPPVQVITELADELDAARIVLGWRGTNGVPSLPAGSTAAEITHTERRPVVVVRGTATNDDAPVVLGVDGSRSCDPAVAFAFDYAARRGATLCAVHAWSDVPLAIPAEPVRELYDEELDALAAAMLGDFPERYPEVKVDWAVVADRPAHALMERSTNAQLLVVGSHGRGVVRRALLGSVSHTAVHNADCPVAVLRSS